MHLYLLFVELTKPKYGLSCLDLFKYKDYHAAAHPAMIEFPAYV